MLRTRKKIENGNLHFELEGALDTLSSPAFEAELEPLLKEAKSVTLDFAKLDYISSAGLRVLVAAEQELEEKGAGQVTVLNANEEVRNIFSMTGFDELLCVK